MSEMSGNREPAKPTVPFDPDLIDPDALTAEQLRKMEQADKAVELSQTGVATSAGEARLVVADATVAEQRETGASTYSEDALESLVMALVLGDLDVQDEAILSQMATEIESKVLDPATLPATIRTHLRIKRALQDKV